jgi:hypothetical protein
MSSCLYPFLPSPLRDGGVRPLIDLVGLYGSLTSFDTPRMGLLIYHVSCNYVKGEGGHTLEQSE